MPSLPVFSEALSADSIASSAFLEAFSAVFLASSATLAALFAALVASSADSSSDSTYSDVASSTFASAAFAFACSDTFLASSISAIRSSLSVRVSLTIPREIFSSIVSSSSLPRTTIAESEYSTIFFAIWRVSPSAVLVCVSSA